jgi:NADH:ubiquinone oxidoreductase subunit C
MKAEPEIKVCNALEIFNQALKVKLKNGDLIAIAASRDQASLKVSYYFQTDDEEQAFQVIPLDERIASLYLLFPTADYSESEIHARWGVKFIGNPHLALKDKV